MRRALIVLLLGTLALTGCLDFESQETLACRANGSQDLYLLLLYHGLFSTETSNPDKARADLDSLAVNTGQFTMFGSFGVNLQDIRDHLGKADRSETPAQSALAAYAVEHIEVGMGKLYRDAATGKLGAYQVVRMRGVDRLLRLTNAALWEVMNQDNFKLLEKYPLTRNQWREASGSAPWDFVSLKGSALKLDLRLVPDEAAKFRQDLLTPLLQDAATTDGQTALTTFLANNTFSIEQKSGRIALTVGDPEARFNHYESAADPAKHYTNNLIQYADKRSLWTGSEDTQWVVREFRQNPAGLFRTLETNLAEATGSAR